MMIPDSAAEALRAARGIVVLTGAGVSAESGIRTFRDTMEGLWKEFDPARLATPQAFDADPAMVSEWYDWRRRGCMAAEPNPGHIGIAEIERRITEAGGKFTLLTQNVDRLHQRGGSRHVVELHGSIIEWRCTRTGERSTPGPDAFPEYPMRTAAGGVLRPDVVWFGEMLPEEALRKADESMTWCDLFISVGTSSIVYPAAGYIEIAAARGARTMEINRDETGCSSLVTWSLRGNSGEVLPKLVEMAFGVKK